MIGKINDHIRDDRVWEFFQPYTLGTQSPNVKWWLGCIITFWARYLASIGSLGIWYCSKTFARHNLDISVDGIKKCSSWGKGSWNPIIYDRCFTSPVVSRNSSINSIIPWHDGALVQHRYPTFHPWDWYITYIYRKNQPKVHIPVPWILWVMHLFLKPDVSLNVILGPFCRLNSNHRLWGFQQIWSQINENAMVVSAFF